MTESGPVLAGATLELDRKGPASGTFLDGPPLEDGTIVEVQLADCGWLALRYETRWMEGLWL